MANARQIAARVITRVWSTDAFAAAVLDAELGRIPDIDPRDAGLTTELVYGVLRTQQALETRLQSLTKTGRIDLAEAARAHLLIGAYSICFLDRIPAFAAVNEAATAIATEGDSRATSFANAILRKLASEIEVQGRPSLPEAAAASAPGWLRGALRRTLGRREAEAYLSAGPVPPPIGLSLRSGEDRATWIAELQKVLPTGTFEEGKASPRAILVRGAGDVRRLPGAGTAWIIQEEGAQIVALALGAMPGDRVLDACSGRGNKTWLLADAVGKTGTVDAADLYPNKLERLRSSSFGDAVHDTFAIDWSVDNQSSDAPPRDYDRVLVDAPCSGIGTLRRRPEIALHRTIDDIKRLADLQTVIVRNAAKHVKAGGRLVFAVCSVLREEAENVVEQLVQQPMGSEIALLPAPFDSSVLQPLMPEGATSMRLLPHVQGTDGYFIASFEVRR